MINSEPLPDNWEIMDKGEDYAVLESDDRCRKVQLSTVTVTSHEEPLPRIQGYQTENPYQPGYGNKCVDLILEPDKCLEDNLIEAIEELKQE